MNKKSIAFKFWIKMIIPFWFHGELFKTPSYIENWSILIKNYWSGQSELYCVDDMSGSAFSV